MKPDIQTQIAPEVEKTTAPELQWGVGSLFGGSAKQIAVGRNIDGHLEVFYVGIDNYLYHRRQTAPMDNLWFAETRFPNDSATQVAVGSNADGRLEIFYVWTNSHLYHSWQTTPNGGRTGEPRSRGQAPDRWP